MSLDALLLKLRGAPDDAVEQQTGLKYRGHGFYASDEVWASLQGQFGRLPPAELRRRREQLVAEQIGLAADPPGTVGHYMGIPIVPTMQISDRLDRRSGTALSSPSATPPGPAPAPSGPSDPAAPSA